MVTNSGAPSRGVDPVNATRYGAQKGRRINNSRLALASRTRRGKEP